MKRSAKVVWEGGNSRCPHERLKTITEPTGVVLYGQPWKKNGKVIEGKPFVLKRDSVKCQDCGAVCRVRA
jgi:hypothetical protein